MASTLKTIYEHHHATARPSGFSILEEERAEILTQVIGTGKKVLDIGCRDGNLTKHFINGNTVVGVDIDENALRKAQNDLGIKTLAFDLGGDWGLLGGEQFDAIVAGEILEHVYYPAAVVEKIAAHLRPGGVFLASVPNAFSLKNRLRYLLGTKRYTPLSDPTHINHFFVKEFQNMVGKHFSKVEVIGLGRFKRLSKLFPQLFAFDIFVVARK